LLGAGASTHFNDVYLKNFRLTFRGRLRIYPDARQYERLVREGFVCASRSYSGRQNLFPTLKDFRSAHADIFSGVSGDASFIRDGVCIVEIFGSYVEECDLAWEFDLLGRQIGDLAANVRTIQDGVVIVAFTHARIVAAQPAVFGNKRTAMCLGLSQIRALFPTIMVLQLFSLNAYCEALEAAIMDGRADPLNQVFGQMLGVPGPFTGAPFSVRCGENSKRRQKSWQSGHEKVSHHGNRLEMLTKQ
jgi:hypothetical protein